VRAGGHSGVIADGWVGRGTDLGVGPRRIIHRSAIFAFRT